MKDAKFSDGKFSTILVEPRREIYNIPKRYNFRENLLEKFIKDVLINFL